MNTILYLVAVSFVNVIRFIPLKLLVFVGRQIGFLFYFIDAPHRKVAVNNLTNSLGSSRSKKEIIALARENFRRLGEVYLSSIKTAPRPGASVGRAAASRACKRSARVHVDRMAMSCAGWKCHPAHGRYGALRRTPVACLGFPLRPLPHRVAHRGAVNDSAFIHGK